MKVLPSAQRWLRHPQSSKPHHPSPAPRPTRVDMSSKQYIEQRMGQKQYLRPYKHEKMLSFNKIDINLRNYLKEDLSFR